MATSVSPIGNMYFDLDAIPDPTADLVLWHTGYKAAPISERLFNQKDWDLYTDQLLEFASTNQFKTVCISIIFGDGAPTLPPDSLTYVNQFISKLEAQGFLPAIEIGFPNPNTTLADIGAYLAKVESKNPLRLGIDHEGNNVGDITADNALAITQKIRAALADVNYSDFTIFGAMNPKDGWDNVIYNAYEYYSHQDPKGSLNNVFSEHVNDPVAAFNSFQDLLSTDKSIISPNKIPGPYSAPAFAISRSDADCLGGQLAPAGKLNPCGITDIMGQWEWDKVNDFLGLFTQAYPGTEEIFIFQGDQLPCDWVTCLPDSMC